MFARKQKAFSVPTRQDLNALWLKARKEVGSPVIVYISQPSLSNSLVELSVKCYRSSLQPRWQFSLLDGSASSEKSGAKYGAYREISGECSDTLISSDLSVVSGWLSKCLLASKEPKISAVAYGHDLGAQWCEDSLDEIDDDKQAVDISCAALFQAFSAGLATGRLSIENTVFLGAVDWLDGRIVRAHWSKLAGSEALIQMILLNRGRYSFDSGLGSISDGLARSSSIKSDLSISLDLVLLEAAYRQDQLNFLLADVCLSSVAIKRRENMFSQARLNRKLTQTCGHQYLVYCLELLRFLGQEEIDLSELQRRTSLPDNIVLQAIAVLVRAGFVRLNALEVASNSSQNSLLLLDAAGRFDVEESLYRDFRASLQSNSPMSFVLIKSLLGKTSEALRAKVRSMLSESARAYEIDDRLLLVALPNCSSLEAAEFVRRLRVKSNKAIYMKRLFAQSCANFAFLSSVVSAPEDGSELQIVLGNARKALTVFKRLNKGP